MYVEVYFWNVFDRLKEGKKVCAIDTKNNQVFDLLKCSTKDFIEMLDVSSKTGGSRIIFYYWQEEDEKNEQV